MSTLRPVCHATFDSEKNQESKQVKDEVTPEVSAFRIALGARLWHTERVSRQRCVRRSSFLVSPCLTTDRLDNRKERENEPLIKKREQIFCSEADVQAAILVLQEQQIILKSEQFEQDHDLNSPVPKPWGQEQRVYADNWYDVWSLCIHPKQATSMHCHPRKETALLCLSGSGEVTFLDQPLYPLREGDWLSIGKGVFHATTNTGSEALLLIEVELPRNKLDLIRLRDDYGRDSAYERTASLATLGTMVPNEREHTHHVPVAIVEGASLLNEQMPWRFAISLGLSQAMHHQIQILSPTDAQTLVDPHQHYVRILQAERKRIAMPSRAVILTGPGFQDHDVVFCYYRLLEEGYQVDIATKQGMPVLGKYGVPLPMDKTASPLIGFEDLHPERYDVVICTGGHEAPDRVRQDRHTLAFVSDMATSGKIVAGLCHGPWIMVSAGVLRGKRACAYVGMVDDMKNAGALLEDARVVVDENIITCSYYAFCGEFMQAVFTAVKRLHTEGIMVWTPSLADGLSVEEQS